MEKKNLLQIIRDDKDLLIAISQYKSIPQCYGELFDLLNDLSIIEEAIKEQFKDTDDGEN